ncbi:MAG TPA: sulfatase-like hydrolase/transferase [Burkholderiaceae bacterium]|nr:sulfatase-like hydrolase/transferase [Burkholderiaceae bacterium]
MRHQHTYKVLPQIPVIAALLALSIYTLTRLGLTLFTGFDGTVFKGFEAVPLALWPEVFVKGFWFDLCVISVLLAPICLYEALLPNQWRGKTWHRVLRMVWFWLAIALLLFGAVAESTFWLEFSTRFNFIALDYLIYTTEVIGNIRESYPVGWILAGIGAVAAIVLLFIWSAIRRADAQGVTWLQRAALALFALVVPATLMYYGNIDQMEQPLLPALSPNVNTKNAYASELSGNGLFTIAAAQRRNELDYDKFYRTISQQQANTALADLGVKRTPLGDDLQAKPVTALHAAVTPFSSKPKNVILISVESLSASFMDSYRAEGAALGLTPELDKLAKNGMKFERLFATGTRTVRGLEALSLGTPPIPGQAIVRRPGNEHLSTMGELLKPQGFATFFFYGGYGYFDNMNAYYAANNYHVVDRTDIPKSAIGFENVWGVADEYLFDHVIRTLDDKSDKSTGGKPFFAQIMTTSNHRPYTYPANRIDIPSPGGREGAVKYTDYAIGKFIKDASKKPWFKDTLFVIVADHCASAAGKTRLPVAGYHIPAIFYAPALLKPSVFSPLVSQIDIAPTLMDVLGMKGVEQFFGQSFFSAAPAAQRAFISNYQALGYLKNNTLTVLLPKQEVESFSIDPTTMAATARAVDPLLLNEAIAYYQTASKAYKTGALKVHKTSAAK